MLLSNLQLGYEIYPDDPIEVSIHYGESILDFVNKKDEIPNLEQQFQNNNMVSRFQSNKSNEDLLVGQRNMNSISFTRFNLRPRNTNNIQRNIVGIM